MRVGIVDDDLALARMLAEDIDSDTVVAAKAQKALEWIEQGRIDCLLSDFKMPGMDGLELLEKIQSIEKDFPVIIMTGHASISGAVKAIKRGAWVYLEKPVSSTAVEALLGKIEKEIKNYKQLEAFRENQSLEAKASRLIGTSERMEELRELIGRVAGRDINILIKGETGTGKDLIARELHARSDRSAAPFMVVNCAAIPGELLEGELFGYLRGAFTGAVENKKGKLELAESGTVFLDEIGELSLSLQPKLLRAIEQGEITRLGGDFPQSIDVRFVAATNRELVELMEVGEFRKDLYYRLNAFEIKAPTLTEHSGDIPELVEHFLKDVRVPGQNKIKYSEDVMEALVDYHWPGNVRELKNVVERAAILAGEEEITKVHLPAEIVASDEMSAGKTGFDNWAHFGDDLDSILDNIERKIIKQALAETEGNKSRAARKLGISRQSLHYKLK
jgi:DNA-binding NtrC family response regulator